MKKSNYEEVKNVCAYKYSWSNWLASEQVSHFSLKLSFFSISRLILYTTYIIIIIIMSFTIVKWAQKTTEKQVNSKEFYRTFTNMHIVFVFQRIICLITLFRRQWNLKIWVYNCSEKNNTAWKVYTTIIFFSARFSICVFFIQSLGI